MRRRFLSLGCSLGVLTAVWAPVVKAQAPTIRFEDDRATAVTGDLKVCFYRGLETACVDRAPYDVPEAFRDFQGLTAEGPRHGPVDVVRAQLDVGVDGAVRVTIPRKTLVVLTGGKTSSPLALRLYRRGDETFGRPAFRFEHLDPASVWVPSGEFVAAISDDENAPDLQFLSARPGGRVELAYRPRPGWSLVVRCVSGDARVANAVLGLEEPRKRAVVASVRSAGDGLALFSGISQPWVVLSAAANGYLPSEEPGVMASRRTIAFRGIALRRGGSVRARITIAGLPAAGARCELIDPEGQDEEGSRLAKSLVRSTTKAGANGLCETPRVEPGPYLLRVTPSGADNAEDDFVNVVEGETSEVDESLGRYEIRGRVTRGEHPAPNLVVVAINEFDVTRASAPGHSAAPPKFLRARTDENGEYHGVVFRRGTYVVQLVDDGLTVMAEREKVDVGGEGATVDFALNAASIEGTVIDQDGNPVAGAHTTLKVYVDDGEVFRPGETDDEGRFSFSLGGEARVEVGAGKRGYGRADPIPLHVLPDADITPVTIVLTRLDALTGHVVDASGAPVSGVRVASYGTPAGLPPVAAGATTTDADGAFSVEKALGAGSRLFLTGGSCPMQIVDVANDDQDHILVCPESSSGFEITFHRENDRPISGESIRLEWDGRLIPHEELGAQFASTGSSATSDGAGRLTLVGIPAGQYRLFLLSGSSEALIAGGQRFGFIEERMLAPADTAQVDVREASGGDKRAAAGR